MGRGKNNKNNKKNKKELPFVSVCTPTFNRRPFIKSMIKCFDHQLYPPLLVKEKLYSSSYSGFTLSPKISEFSNTWYWILNYL